MTPRATLESRVPIHSNWIPVSEIRAFAKVDLAFESDLILAVALRPIPVH